MAMKKILTPEFRVSFPHMFTSHTGFEGQAPKFSLVMLFPKGTDISSLKKLAKDAAQEKWGDKMPKKLHNPFRDGDEKEDLDGYKNCVFINASTKQRPGLVDRQKQAIITPDEFYAGCYARATVNVYAWEQKSFKTAGVSFGLQNVQKLRDGDPFSGRTKAEDDFDALEDLAEGGGKQTEAEKESELFD